MTFFLESKSYRIRFPETPGDGNCLFHCISDDRCRSRLSTHLKRMHNISWRERGRQSHKHRRRWRGTPLTRSQQAGGVSVQPVPGPRAGRPVASGTIPAAPDPAAAGMDVEHAERDSGSSEAGELLTDPISAELTEQTAAGNLDVWGPTRQPLPPPDGSGLWRGVVYAWAEGNDGSGTRFATRWHYDPRRPAGPDRPQAMPQVPAKMGVPAAEGTMPEEPPARPPPEGHHWDILQDYETWRDGSQRWSVHWLLRMEEDRGYPLDLGPPQRLDFELRSWRGISLCDVVTNCYLIYSIQILYRFVDSLSQLNGKLLSPRLYNIEANPSRTLTVDWVVGCYGNNRFHISGLCRASACAGNMLDRPAAGGGKGGHLGSQQYARSRN